YSREVAGRPAEARHQPIPDRVSTDEKDDGNSCCRGARRDCRGKGVGEDRVHLTANQLGREGWQAIILVRMLQLDNYIAPFDIAQIVQALAERFQVIRSWWSSSAQPS